MPITELWLEGNPLCDKYDEHTYIQAVKEICPKIVKLVSTNLKKMCNNFACRLILTYCILVYYNYSGGAWFHNLGVHNLKRNCYYTCQCNSSVISTFFGISFFMYSYNYFHFSVLQYNSFIPCHIKYYC